MSDLLNPAISAVVAKLAANAGMQSVLGNPVRIYDQRPAMATFPFAVCEGLQGRDASAKELQIQSLLLTLQVFSRQRSGGECRTILAVLRDCLHDAALSGVTRCQEEATLVTFDPDSGGTQGLARYRLVVSA
jgi:hypothetical protein